MTMKTELQFSEKEKAEVLKNFMKEHFDFKGLCKAGFFTKEMKNDYPAQAERVCMRLGLKSIYEYGTEKISCHISYEKGKRPENEGFVYHSSSWLDT